jgi:hypothetical protein
MRLLFLLLLAACVPTKREPVDTGADLDSDADTDTPVDTDTGGDTDTDTPVDTDTGGDTDTAPQLDGVTVTWDPMDGDTLSLTTRQTVRFTVVAHYDDLTSVDVTAGATFASSDEGVLKFYTPGVGQPLDGGAVDIVVTPNLREGEDRLVLPVTVTVVPAVPGDLSLNEILADPASTADANGDSVFDAVEDEFLEITNASDVTVDMSGVSIWDEALLVPRHTFPEGTRLRAGEALVVFGGGDTSALSAPFVTFSAAANDDVGLRYGLALNNEGDRPSLRSPAGDELAAAPYGDAGGADAIDDASLVLSPEVFGADYTHHRYVPGSIGDQSPGTFADGSPFPGPDGRY